MIRSHATRRLHGLGLFVGVSATIGVSASVGVPVLAAQESPAQLTAAPIAQAWGVPAEDVVLGDAGDLPERADSVHAQPAANGRWLVTFWVDGAAVRRFVRAGRETPVPVATRALPRGSVIEAGDVRVESRVVWGGLPAPDSPLGLVAQRRIPAGEVLRDPAVRPPYLVTGGQQIEAVLARSGVVMTVQGEALGSAREGDLLLVRLASGMRAEARAVSPGRVQLIDGGS